MLNVLTKDALQVAIADMEDIKEKIIEQLRIKLLAKAKKNSALLLPYNNQYTSSVYYSRYKRPVMTTKKLDILVT